jgi:dynein heavy chain
LRVPPPPPPRLQALNCIYDARVPPQWLKKSWKSSTLAQWFYAGLVQRTQELNAWLNTGRPKAYWLTGFFNPQGFLTAVQQEVTRKHQAQNWSLDDVMVATEITSHEKEDVDRQDRLEEGVHIWGLFLEGADWDRKAAKLVDAPPKKLFCPIPCMFVTAVKKGGRETAGNSYRCPCYTIPARTGLNWVFDANVRSEDPTWYWVLRGVALMCAKD